MLATLGADIEARTNKGQTRLHLAASSRHKSLIRVLAELGVDMDARDSDGQAAIHLAAEEGHDAVVRLLVADSRPTKISLTITAGMYCTTQPTQDTKKSFGC